MPGSIVILTKGVIRPSSSTELPDSSVAPHIDSDGDLDIILSSEDLEDQLAEVEIDDTAIEESKAFELLFPDVVNAEAPGHSQLEVPEVNPP